MDPNATLCDIDQFLALHKSGPEVDLWAHDLYQWIARGGFEPRWTDYPLGTSYYQSRAVHEPYSDAEVNSWFD